MLQSSITTEAMDMHRRNLENVSLSMLEKQKRDVRHHFGRFLPTDRSARIADLRLGFPMIPYYLQRAGYINVEGLVSHPSEIAIVKRLGITGVSREDLSSFLMARSDTFDVIFAIDIIDHFPKGQVLDILRTIHRSLKPSGKFIMQVTNGAAPFFGRQRYGDISHEFALTAQTSWQLLKAGGFANIRAYGKGPYVHGPRSFVRWIAWKVVRALAQAYVAIESGRTRGEIFEPLLIVSAERQA